MKINVVRQSDVTGTNDVDDSVYGNKAGKRFITIDHAGGILHWSFPSRTWTTANDAHATVFDQLNAYFASLSFEHQTAIFNEYANIHRVQRSTNARNSDTCEDLIEAITPIVTRLFSLIDQEHLYNWVWNVLRPTIPMSSSAKVFDPMTMPGSSERTYLYDDYKKLIPLIIVLRMACPFWFDFIELTGAALNPDHKDMTAYGLLAESWPVKSVAMLRLVEFIDHTVGPEKNNPAAILLGIGSNTFVHWIMASMVIVRIPVVDVMGSQPDKQVVSALYNFIIMRISTLRKSQPSINNKFAETFSTDENNQSFLEGFRNRIDLTIGNEADGDYYLERALDQLEKGERIPLSLMERVAPGIDHALIRDSLRTAKKLDITQVIDEQINLAAWLFHPYSQVRASSNFVSSRILTLLGLAQAVLLHLGKIDLAVLVTGQYTLNQVDESVHVLGETVASLKSAEKEAYRKIFPLEKTSRNQRLVINPVMDDVYKLVTNMQNYNINCSFSKNAMTKAFPSGDPTNRRYFLRRDAVVMVMEYVKYLAERPIVRIDPDEVYRKLMLAKVGVTEQPTTF